MKPTIRQFLALSTAAFLLASCASFSGIEPAAQRHSLDELASTNSLAAQDGQWPDHSWPSTIGGAPLQALVDEAYADNPGLQQAAARVAAAQAVEVVHTLRQVVCVKG